MSSVMYRNNVTGQGAQQGSTSSGSRPSSAGVTRNRSGSFGYHRGTTGVTNLYSSANPNITSAIYGQINQQQQQQQQQNQQQQQQQQQRPSSAGYNRGASNGPATTTTLPTTSSPVVGGIYSNLTSGVHQNPINLNQIHVSGNSPLTMNNMNMNQGSTASGGASTGARPRSANVTRTNPIPTNTNATTASFGMNNTNQPFVPPPQQQPQPQARPTSATYTNSNSNNNNNSSNNSSNRPGTGTGLGAALKQSYTTMMTSNTNTNTNTNNTDNNNTNNTNNNNNNTNNNNIILQYGQPPQQPISTTTNNNTNNTNNTNTNNSNNTLLSPTNRISSSSSSNAANKLRQALDLSQRLDHTTNTNTNNTTNGVQSIGGIPLSELTGLPINGPDGGGGGGQLEEGLDDFALLGIEGNPLDHSNNPNNTTNTTNTATNKVMIALEEEEMDGKPFTSYSTRSSQHPEVSMITSNPSMDLNGGHSHSIQGVDIRNTSLDDDQHVYTEDSQAIIIGLSTLPNQFCTKHDALELKKLLLLSQSTRGGIVPSSSAVMDMYMVGKVVGVGSYGKVRCAWHRLTGCKVAIKTYDKAKLKDPSHWKRVHSEIKIMEQISHPRIARMYEAVETPKRMHLIMECLDGGNLCSYVKQKKRLTEDESRKIFFQILTAIDHLHVLGVSHRDIKLENVLFTNDATLTNGGDIKLIDFGFSTVCQPGKKLKVFCGTPSYMAPEIVRRVEYEGKPVDIWSLGILLYALLCGCFPFRAKAYPDLYRRIARGTFQIPEELSAPVKDLLKCLLTVDPITRITATQAMRHPWLQVSLYHAPNLDKLKQEMTILISDKPQDDLDEEVLAECLAFGLTKEDLIRIVLTKTHCSVATLYYLLLDVMVNRRRSWAKKQSGGGGGSMKGTNSRSVLTKGSTPNSNPNTQTPNYANPQTQTQIPNKAMPTTQPIMVSSSNNGNTGNGLPVMKMGIPTNDLLAYLGGNGTGNGGTNGNGNGITANNTNNRPKSASHLRPTGTNDNGNNGNGTNGMVNGNTGMNNPLAQLMAGYVAPPNILTLNGNNGANGNGTIPQQIPVNLLQSQQHQQQAPVVLPVSAPSQQRPLSAYATRR